MSRVFELALIALLFCSFIPDAHAQSGLPVYLCEECGDPAVDPEDYRNFAANTARFGNFDDFDDIDQFIIVNSDGAQVIVDVDWQFRRFGFEGFSLPVWPEWTYTITLQLPNGDLIEYTLHRQHGVLPVPYPDGDGSSAPPASTNNSDDEEDDYSEDEEENENNYDDEYEFPEIEEDSCSACEIYDWDEEEQEWEESEWLEEL